MHVNAPFSLDMQALARGLLSSQRTVFGAWRQWAAAAKSLRMQHLAYAECIGMQRTRRAFEWW